MKKRLTVLPADCLALPWAAAVLAMAIALVGKLPPA